MTRFLKLALVFSAIAFLPLLALAGTPNDFFEFCTTTAWGYPFPWRVDYCLCEGGESVTPLPYVGMNLGLIAVAGLVGAGIFSRWKPAGRD